MTVGKARGERVSEGKGERRVERGWGGGGSDQARMLEISASAEVQSGVEPTRRMTAQFSRH